MQPRGPLMAEHRLIERMIARLETEIGSIRRHGGIDTRFIDTAVDFLRTYADRTHHGKEEDILFKTLKPRQLRKRDADLMDELIDEHVFARKTTTALVAAVQRFAEGDGSAVDIVLSKLTDLTNLYPQHIQKEDKLFFPASMEYLSEEEQRRMLAEFDKFDKTMIHEKYRTVVEELEE